MRILYTNLLQIAAKDNKYMNMLTDNSLNESARKEVKKVNAELNNFNKKHNYSET